MPNRILWVFYCFSYTPLVDHLSSGSFRFSNSLTRVRVLPSSEIVNTSLILKPISPPPGTVITLVSVKTFPSITAFEVTVRLSAVIPTVPFPAPSGNFSVLAAPGVFSSGPTSVLVTDKFVVLTSSLICAGTALP